MSLRSITAALLFLGVAGAGINWKSVWLEPRTAVVLAPGETKPFTAMGRNGEDAKADLTRSPDLSITSSDPAVLEVDRVNARFTGKRPGHANIRLSFNDAAETVPAFVRPPKAAGANPNDGVWRAVFTGDPGQRPKMVDEILFDVNVQGSTITGTVHASGWPGDAAISNGKVAGDQLWFEMVGHLPFQAGRPGAMVAGYPKLCFSGVRQGDEMHIDLLWSIGGKACDGGRLLPMAAKRLAD